MSLQDANITMKRWLADRPHVRAVVDSADTAALMAAIAAYGAARVQQERAACLSALDGFYHGDACRAILRSRAANAEEPGFTCPGCGRPTNVVYNRSSCPSCTGQD